MKHVAFLMVAALALAGCKTSEQRAEEHREQVSASLRPYVGHTLEVFLNDWTDFRPVDRYAVKGGQEFVMETAPVVVTRHLPAYQPSNSGHYNNPQLGAAFGNVASAFATPGVSRTETQVCRVFIRATPISEEASPSSWLIDRIDWAGYC